MNFELSPKNTYGIRFCHLLVLGFLLVVAVESFSQSPNDFEHIQKNIADKNFREALRLINTDSSVTANRESLLLKAEIFTTLNQKDSAFKALEQYKGPQARRLHYLRNANYYFAYLNYAVKFNEFDQVDKITRLYMAEPIGMLQRRLRQYPQYAHLIPVLSNKATGYYIHLAYLNAIEHPARFEAYEKSRLYDENEYDYKEWFGNIDHFYLAGKWNRRAYQAIRAARLKDPLAEVEAYDNLLTFNNGHIYVDEEHELDLGQLSTRLDSIETILTNLLPAGSAALSNAYLKRILFYKEKDAAKMREYFTKTADNKFLYYQNIFPELAYEEQRTAYALDTLFFDFYFKETLPNNNGNRQKFEELLYYSSSWKNYLLLNKKQTLLTKQGLTLKNKQAIIDVIRYSDQGKAKYAITLFTNKKQTIEILDAEPIEKRAYKLWRNSIKYKNPVPPQLTEQFFGSIIKELETLKVKEVFMIPDGIYHLVNPATLLSLNGDDYLSEVYDLKLRLHVNEVNKKTLQLSPTQKVIAFGNPRFSNLTIDGTDRGLETMLMESFVQLPGTADEVTNLTNLMKTEGIQVETYLDTLATETNVKLSFSQADVLHIATHGFFINTGTGFDKQRFSGIALSRDKQNDGILLAQEIRELPQTQASLIVLSACESSLGEISLGEGISGLKSALKGAGTEGLILSYWKVNDKVTSLFMQALYGHIQSNKDHELALKLAMKEIKNKYPEPYYWGAFGYQR